jgi:hypothetical protein
MTDSPSFPRLYSFGSPNDHHCSCNRPLFETGKLFGLTICECVCVCVCVCERAARCWTEVRSQLCSLLGLFSLHLIPPTLTRAVSHYGLTIYMKKYLNAKKELRKLKYFMLQKYNLQKIL